VKIEKTPHKGVIRKNPINYLNNLEKVTKKERYFLEIREKLS
jgi:hypothetical protein